MYNFEWVNSLWDTGRRDLNGKRTIIWKWATGALLCYSLIMRFDKGGKEEIRKTQLECVHPHYTYFLYYSELKQGERGECRQDSNFTNRKDESWLWVAVEASLPLMDLQWPSNDILWKDTRELTPGSKPPHKKGNFQHTLDSNHKQKHKLSELVTSQPGGQSLNKICYYLEKENSKMQRKVCYICPWTTGYSSTPRNSISNTTANIPIVLKKS